MRNGNIHRRTPTKGTRSPHCVEEGNGVFEIDSKKLSGPKCIRHKYLPKRLRLFLGILASILVVSTVSKHETLSEQHHHSRSLQWDFAQNSVQRLTKPLDESNAGGWDRVTSHMNQSNSGSSAIKPMQVSEEALEPCQPMHQWMKDTFPSCNDMHEVQIVEGTISFINCGGSRCAFRIQDISGDPLVLKTQKYSSSFSGRYFQAARTDALAMERLTKSPYVSALFASCGTSQLVEYSNGGNLHDLIKISRLDGEDKQPPLDKLKIAYQIATAVADMHSFERDGITSITHNDLCCHQFILFDGIYKLTDFHLSSFHRRNQITQEKCNETATPINSVLMKLRAPEEQNMGYYEERVVLLDKVDIFMMGNVMYYILTKKWLFEGEKTEDATLRMLKGGRSKFPDQFLKSDDPSIQAVIKAIEMCWTHEAEKRPAAREVSNLLRVALETILGTKILGVVRVSIPPLPKEYRYSDSDFYVNLGGVL